VLKFNEGAPISGLFVFLDVFLDAFSGAFLGAPHASAAISLSLKR
jgi:hypothetical protein